jgi:pimeloyl-ACP methyl ester carboxylesterase
VDWPGHGLSAESAFPTGFSIRRHATATIESLLGLLDVPQVDVVGHSMGAQFGLYASLDLGDRVRRLVLLGAPGAGFLGVKPVLAMKLLAVPGLGKRLLSLPMSEKAFERNNELTLGPGAFKDLPPDLVLAARLLGSRTLNAKSIAAYFRALIKRSSVRTGVAVPLDELGRLRQPTLLAWGDEDVFLTPMAGARSVVAIRDAHLIRVPHAGHAPWLTATETVGRAIATHLRSQPSVSA